MTQRNCCGSGRVVRSRCNDKPLYRFPQCRCYSQYGEQCRRKPPRIRGARHRGQPRLPRRLTVRLRTLTPSIEVRILTGEPFFSALRAFLCPVVANFEESAARRQLVELTARNLTGHRFDFAIDQFQSIYQLLLGRLAAIVLPPQRFGDACPLQGNCQQAKALSP